MSCFPSFWTLTLIDILRFSVLRCLICIFSFVLIFFQDGKNSPGDPSPAMGSVTIYSRSGTTWTQYGPKLVGSGEIGTNIYMVKKGWRALQFLIFCKGFSVALSHDGNTLAFGGPGDNSNQGAVWVFTRTGPGNPFFQQAKLVGSAPVMSASMCHGLDLSADGNTLACGGPFVNSNIGATWVFVRVLGVWSEEARLVGPGYAGAPEQGRSCSLSNDGNTLAIGARADNGFIGAAWIFVRSGGLWSPQGSKLVGSGSGPGEQGRSVSLSGDGNLLALGSYQDNGGFGESALFVFIGWGADLCRCDVHLFAYSGRVGTAGRKTV